VYQQPARYVTSLRGVQAKSQLKPWKRPWQCGMSGSLADRGRKGAATSLHGFLVALVLAAAADAEAL